MSEWEVRWFRCTVNTFSLIAQFVLDLHSGALSQGEAFINLYKSHPSLFTDKDFYVYKQIKVKKLRYFKILELGAQVNKIRISIFVIFNCLLDRRN